MDKHPLEGIWQNVAEQFEAIPDIATLPKDEIIRLCKVMYFYGLTTMSLGILTLDNLSKDHDKKDMIRLRYLEHTTRFVAANLTGSLEQMIATIRAHEVKEPAE